MVMVISGRKSRRTAALLPYLISLVALGGLPTRTAVGLATDVTINEFMADNKHTLADEDGTYPDWIELQNTAASPVNLSGWLLTDDPTHASRWSFPATNLAANFDPAFDLAGVWPERLDPPEKSGGGEMTNMGCYAIDYVVSLLGRPRSVSATARRRHGRDRLRGPPQSAQRSHSTRRVHARLRSPLRPVHRSGARRRGAVRSVGWVPEGSRRRLGAVTLRSRQLQVETAEVFRVAQQVSDAACSRSPAFRVRR